VNLHELANAVGAVNLTPELPLNSGNIELGYASDLLSDVLASAPSGGVLVTIQVHMNVIAVAVHAGLVAVIFASDRKPDEEVRRRAIEEGIVLFMAPESAFDIVGKLYASGVRGPQE